MAELRDILKSGDLDSAEFQSTKSPVLVWRGVYDGSDSIKGDVKREGAWTMVAVNDTVDAPAPFPVGDVEPALSGEAFATQSEIATITMKHTYTMASSGWVNSMKVWVPAVGASITHRLWISNITDIDNPRVFQVLLPDLIPDQWNVVPIGQEIGLAGEVFAVVLTASNASTETTVTGDWTKLAKSDATVPLAGEWVANNARTRIRINVLDDLGADRKTELMTSIQESVWQFIQDGAGSKSQVFVQISAPIDGGTYVEFDVTETQVGLGGRVDNSALSGLTLTIPTSEAMQYSEDTNYTTPLPDFLTSLVPELQFDGVVQTIGNSVFGIDFEFQRGSISPDWEVVAYAQG